MARGDGRYGARLVQRFIEPDFGRNVDRVVGIVVHVARCDDALTDGDLPTDRFQHRGRHDDASLRLHGVQDQRDTRVKGFAVDRGVKVRDDAIDGKRDQDN